MIGKAYVTYLRSLHPLVKNKLNNFQHMASALIIFLFTVAKIQKRGENCVKIFLIVL